MDDTSRLKIGVPRSRFLVYTSAGDRSNVERWVSGRKDFDLWVTHYGAGSDRLREIADFYNERRGGKYPNLHDVYAHWGPLLAQYAAIAVFDDDIEIDGTDISHLFRILIRYQLVVLQPGFLRTGKISHRVTIATNLSFARRTNFVENGVSLFAKAFLDRFMKIYDPRLIGWGTDWWFLHLLRDDERQRVAVVDAIACVNPDERLEKRAREVDVLQPTSKRREVWEEIKAAHGIEFPPDGVRTLGRLWPTATEDWLAIAVAPLKRLRVFLFYPHHTMRIRRFYWRLSWRLRGSRNAW